MGIIISAYPACGKSHATKTLTELGMKVADSDSSKFSWIYEDSGEKRRNPNFVEDYLKHIEKAAKENDIVFISSHYEIRQSLRNLGFHFYTVYPKADESERDDLTAEQKSILDCLYYDVVNVTQNKALEDNKQSETSEEIEKD